MKRMLYSLLICSALSSTAQTRYYPYSDGQKWGLVNNNVDVLIAPQYDASFKFGSNKLAIAQKNSKYGAIDLAGNVRVPFLYEELEALTEENGSGKLKGQYALVNFQTGKQVGTLLFDKIGSPCYCKENLFLVVKNEKRGFFNARTGKLIGQIAYDRADFMSDFTLRAKVSNGDKHGVINLATGALVIPIKYSDIWSTAKENTILFAAEEAGVTSYFDQNGKAWKPQKGNEEQEEQIGVVEVASEEEDNGGNKDLYIYNQGNGNWKLTFENRGRSSTEILRTFELSGYTDLKKIYYNNWDKETPALLKAVKDGKAGIIDLAGTVLVPFAYDDIDYQVSYSFTKKDNKVGMLKRDMSELKAPIFKQIVSEDRELNAWLVEMPDARKGYMDRDNGKIYIPGVNE